MKLLRRRWFRNILFFFPILIIITLIAFAIVYFSPGDAGNLLLMKHLSKNIVSKSDAADYARRLGFDGSFFELYGKWMKNILRGDFGRSALNGETVIKVFWSKYKITFLMALISIAVEIIISFSMGLYAGIKKRSAADRFINFWAVVSCAIPPFWIGLIALWFLTIKLQWKHAIGYSGITSLIIPALIMGVISMGFMSKIVRAKTRDVMNKGFVEFSYSQGLSNFDILIYHVLPHVLPAAISIAILDLSSFLGGAVLMEKVFNIPGFGDTLIEAIKFKDYFLISGSLFFIGIMICALNLIADTIYPKLDMRNENEIGSLNKRELLYAENY